MRDLFSCSELPLNCALAKKGDRFAPGNLTDSGDEAIGVDSDDEDEETYHCHGRLILALPEKPIQASGDDELWEEDLDFAVGIKREFDDFGFAVAPPGDKLGDSTISYAKWFQPKAARRRARFEARRNKLKVPGAWTSLPTQILKRLLRKGVPPDRRPEVWWSVLNCEGLRQQSNATYEGYLETELCAKTAEEIERDLQRTFPSHSSFRAAAGRARLRNVLQAYANFNPRIRYCQGINFIAALLLVVFNDEEKAFWSLAAAIQRLGCEGYYSEGMILLRGDVQVLSSLMASKCPKVFRVFQENEIPLTSICSEWFITWFSKCLPVITTLRVWDTLFLEGYKVLFRVALGVFKLREADILRCVGFDSIMLSAKHWPRHMIEHNELLKASFNGVPMLRRRDLLKAREAAVRRVEAEDEERARRATESGRAAAAAREAAAAKRMRELAVAEEEAASTAEAASAVGGEVGKVPARNGTPRVRLQL